MPRGYPAGAHPVQDAPQRTGTVLARVPVPSRARERADREERREARLLALAERAFGSPEVVAALIGGAAGALLAYPLDFVTWDYRLIRDGAFTDPTATWRVTLEPLVFGRNLLPNIDIGSPIPGAGIIPIHIKDWFSLGKMTVVVTVPPSVTVGGRNYFEPDVALDAAMNQLRVLFSLAGFFTGAAATFLLRPVARAATGAVRGTAEVVDHLIPG